MIRSRSIRVNYRHRLIKVVTRVVLSERKKKRRGSIRSW